MKIAAFLKESLIDYPGKLASVIFTQGCNFRCWYCHNPQLVLPDLFDLYHLIDEQIVLNQLANRKNWIEGIVITGGEPTLQPDLPDFIRKIKKMNFEVKLDTNGSNPSMIEQLLKDKLIDYIAVDVKTTLNAQRYSSIIGTEASAVIERIFRSIQLILQYNLTAEIRTVKLPDHHTPEMLREIAKYAGHLKYKVTDFRDSETIQNYLQNSTKQKMNIKL